jgi:hypothetical protein
VGDAALLRSMRCLEFAAASGAASWYSSRYTLAGTCLGVDPGSGGGRALRQERGGSGEESASMP